MSKAQFHVDGLDDLMKQLSRLDTKVRLKLSEEAISEAADIMLENLKSEAPKADINSTYSYACLDKEIMLVDNTHQAKMGINADNWENTRGLWFHYWGFYNHPRDLWVDRAFLLSVDECERVMKRKIEDGLKRW